MPDNPTPETPAGGDVTPIPPPRCMHFFCKAMLVYGEAFEQDPDYQAGMTDYWCQLTQKPCGPDGGEITLPLCSDPKRGCYQAY